MVIGTLAIDGWAVTFSTVQRALGGAHSPPRPLLAVPNVTAHPSTESVPSSYYSIPVPIKGLTVLASGTVD